MIKRIFKAIRNKISPPILSCKCGRHHCCFRHNYKFIGDGRLKLRKRALQCERFSESLTANPNIKSVH